MTNTVEYSKPKEESPFDALVCIFLFFVLGVIVAFNNLFCRLTHKPTEVPAD